MKRHRLLPAGMSLAGLLGAYIIALLAVEVREWSHSFWVTFGVVATVLAGYYTLVHPRLRKFEGYEYASLNIGILGFIALFGLFLMAMDY